MVAVDTANGSIGNEVGLLTDEALALRELADAASRVGTELRTRRDTLRRLLRDMNPAPKMFVGYIRDYRYTVGREGEMPSHRFYVECDLGVWLYAQVPSSVFEALMVDSTGLEITPDGLNGRMAVCQPNETLNAIVPVKFVTPIKAADRFGHRLYIDAPVVTQMTVEDTPRTGIVQGEVRDDELIIQVFLDGADETIGFVASQVTRAF